MKKELVIKAEGRLYAEILVDALASFPLSAELTTVTITKLDTNEVELKIIGVWS